MANDYQLYVQLQLGKIMNAKDALDINSRRSHDTINDRTAFDSGSELIRIKAHPYKAIPKYQKFAIYEQ